jgi:hypothetical protein
MYQRRLHSSAFVHRQELFIEAAMSIQAATMRKQTVDAESIELLVFPNVAGKCKASLWLARKCDVSWVFFRAQRKLEAVDCTEVVEGTCMNEICHGNAKSGDIRQARCRSMPLFVI